MIIQIKISSVFKILLKHAHKTKDIPRARQNVEGAMIQLEVSPASFNLET